MIVNDDKQTKQRKNSGITFRRNTKNCYKNSRRNFFAYILSDIFNYKINKIQNNIPRCGFPIY